MNYTNGHTCVLISNLLDDRSSLTLLRPPPEYQLSIYQRGCDRQTGRQGAPYACRILIAQSRKSSTNTRINEYPNKRIPEYTNEEIPECRVWYLKLFFFSFSILMALFSLGKCFSRFFRGFLDRNALLISI